MSEELYKLIAENMTDLVTLLDASGVLTYASPSYKVTLGFEPEEVVGQSMLEGIHPEDLPKVVEQAQRHADEARAGGAVFRRLHKDGTWRWLETHAKPLFDDDGTFRGAVATTRDVTERVKVETALRESEERFRSIVAASPDGIHISRLSDGMIIDVNEGFCTLTGYSRSEIIGMTVSDLGLWVDPAARAELLELLEREGAVRSAEVQLRGSGGRRITALVSGSVVNIDGAASLVSVVKDITALRRADRARRQLEVEVLRAQKAEALARLAGGIAHDFNNLLTGVLGNATYALRQVEMASPARETLEEIVLTATRAAALARKMLAYSGRGQLNLSEIDLSATVEDMSGLLEGATSGGACLSLELSDGLPPIRADVSQIREMVMSLVTNAFEACEDGGGGIEVRTGVVEIATGQSPPAADGEELRPGEYVSLEIRDAGCGMDATTRAAMFEPFFSTKFVGRGLGLAAVLGIVQGHGGAIDVRSSPGEGTTIRVLLPTVGE